MNFIKFLSEADAAAHLNEVKGDTLSDTQAEKIIDAINILLKLKEGWVLKPYTGAIKHKVEKGHHKFYFITYDENEEEYFVSYLKLDYDYSSSPVSDTFDNDSDALEALEKI